MTATDFQPIFDYMDFKFAEFREQVLVEVRDELREMKDQIADVVFKLDTLNNEMIVANSRVRRLEGWAEPVGRKVKIPFKY